MKPVNLNPNQQAGSFQKRDRCQFCGKQVEKDREIIIYPNDNLDRCGFPTCKDCEDCE